MATSIKLLPRANSNLFSGKLTAPLGASDTYFVGDTPSSVDKLPTYLWINYGASNQELTMAYDVSGNNVYIKRGLNTGGVGQFHNTDSQYREAITSFHFNKLADSMEDEWADEHTEVYTFTKLSDTQFKITGVDRTNVYTADTIIKFNGSVIATVSSSSYASGDTTVNVSGGTVPATISSVEIFLNRVFGKEHNADGTHKSTLVTTLKATGAEIDTGTDDTKIVTPKAIADSTRLPNGKATGTDVDTGTNDVKFLTPKAVADSKVVSTAKAIANNEAITQKDSGGTARQLIKLNASNDTEVGTLGWLKILSDTTNNKWLLFPAYRQGGNANSFNIPGTTNYKETEVFIQFGVASISITTGGVRAYTNVTFPQAFAQAPFIVVSPGINPVMANGTVECYIDNSDSAPTTTGFRVYGQIQNIGGTTNMSVFWLAIGRK